MEPSAEEIHEHIRNECLKLVSLMGDLSRDMISLKGRIAILEADVWALKKTHEFKESTAKEV